MKIGIIILSVILGLWIITKIVKLLAKSNMNPIDSIKFNSVMGIHIGEKWNRVLNRMLHVGLITREDFNCMYNEYKKLNSASEFEKMFVNGFTSTIPYNNISYVRFHITNDVLTQIEIQLLPEQTDIEKLEDMVTHILNAKLGTGIKDESSNITFWTDHMTANIYISHKLHSVVVWDKKYNLF